MLLLQPQNASLLVWFCCAAIWLAVLVVLSSDVLSSHRIALSKLLWLGVLWLLPILGGILYAIAGLAGADWSAALGGLFRKSKINAKAQKGRTR